MKNMTSESFWPVMVIALCCLSCHLHQNMTLISNWNSYPIPINQDSLRKYHYSQNDWAVYIKDHSVHVKKALKNEALSELPFKIKPNKNDGSDLYGNLSFLKVDDGYLIGVFRGEWGGHLYWFSLNGKSHYKISDDIVVQFIKRSGKNYAIQGLSHLLTSEGSLISIEVENNKWRAKEYLKLPYAPYAITTDTSGNFIILTSTDLLKVDQQAKITTLIKDCAWLNGLYPNSVIVDGDLFYSGMRAGVFKYNLRTGKQEWLLNY